MRAAATASRRCGAWRLAQLSAAAAPVSAPAGQSTLPLRSSPAATAWHRAGSRRGHGAAPLSGATSAAVAAATESLRCRAAAAATLRRAQLCRSASGTARASTTSQTASSTAAPDAEEKPFFVTTPIFYVNGEPHIGHLYTALVADVLARWARLHGREVLFSTGTDEHGSKVSAAARDQGWGDDALGLATDVSGRFRALFDDANISYDVFVRTTEPRHARAVRAMWRRLVDQGDVYAGTYAGWYAAADEAFVSEDDTVVDPDTGRRVAAASGAAVEWVEEANYRFRLSRYYADVLRWVQQDEQEDRGEAHAFHDDDGDDAAAQVESRRHSATTSSPSGRSRLAPVEPARRRADVVATLRDALQACGMHEGASSTAGASGTRTGAEVSHTGHDNNKAALDADLSISRPARRVPFGLPVDPADTTLVGRGDSDVEPESIEAQTVYVWLDALTNYLTVTGFPWGDEGGDQESDGAATVAAGDGAARPNPTRLSVARLAAAWPPDVQVIGKDIAKFHAVYWPAFLMSAGVKPRSSASSAPLSSSLPGTVLAHGHWLVGGRKMSKSVGNVVDPVALLAQAPRVPVDFWRFVLLTEARSLSGDSTLPATGADLAGFERARADLASVLGNLLKRSTGLNKLPPPSAPAWELCVLSSQQRQQRRRDGAIGERGVVAADGDNGDCDGAADVEAARHRLVAQAEALYETVLPLMDRGETGRAAKEIFSVLHAANAFFQAAEPWTAAKKGADPTAVDRAHVACYTAQEVVRIACVLLLPFTPTLAEGILDRLGMPHDVRSDALRHADQQRCLRVGWRREPHAVERSFIPFELDINESATK